MREAAKQCGSELVAGMYQQRTYCLAKKDDGRLDYSCLASFAHRYFLVPNFLFHILVVVPFSTIDTALVCEASMSLDDLVCGNACLTFQSVNVLRETGLKEIVGGDETNK